MAEQKPIISIDHVSMRFNLSKEKHESLKEYFVALLHGGVRSVSYTHLTLPTICSV